MPVCTTKACADVQASARTYTGIGSFTYHAEGNEGGIYATRYPHQPDLKSGATIGKGYDMKKRNSKKVKADLISAGVSEVDAEKLSKGAMKSGEPAKKFVQQEDIKDISISPDAQKALFQISYKEELNDVKRIFTKKDTVAKYGSINQETLNPAILEMIVDLKFRGDYTPESRETIQPAIVKNDLTALRTAIENMKGIPSDRQKRRLNFLDEKINEDKNKLPNPSRKPLSGIKI